MKIYLEKRPRHIRVALAIGALVLIAVPMALTISSTQKSKESHSTPTVSTASNALVPPHSSATAAPMPAPRAPMAPTVTGGVTPESLSAQVDRLAKTGDPADAFAAYRVLLKCHESNFCGDIGAGQRTMAYTLLQRAVAGHVPSAAVYLLRTTPDGRDIGEIWHDPAYAEWRDKARREISAAADRGDSLALRQMADLAAMDQRKDIALAYWTAYADRQPAQFKAAAEHVASMYAQGLAPEKAAAAIEQGHKIGGQK